MEAVEMPNACAYSVRTEQKLFDAVCVSHQPKNRN